MKKKQKSSLKNRALSQTAVLIIVTMCIMVTVFYMVFHSRAFNERGKYEEENLVNMEAYLNSYLEEVDSIAKNVNYNYYLQDYLETVIKEEDDYVDGGIGKNMRSYEMSSQAFSDTLLSRADISSIMIFGKKKSVPTAGNVETSQKQTQVETTVQEETTRAIDPNKPMIALTFDDGPGEYTDELLDCLEQNNAHATFFMLGQNVSSYPDAPKRMLELGCEIGSHSWDHTQLTTIDLDAVAKQFSDTDDALIQACGQAASVARAPYGDGNSDIYNTVNKPFFMWSLDTEDWKLLDADADYSAVMNGDLTDGTIILMHDIHEPSVKAALRLIPDLIAQGYKLVTVSEMAEAKNVTLQNACYVDFWPSTLSNGDVPGYQGGSDAAASADGTDGTSDASADSSDGSTDSSDGSEDYSDGGSDDGSYDDGSSDDGSYDDGSSDDSEDYSDDSVDYGDGTE